MHLNRPAMALLLPLACSFAGCGSGDPVADAQQSIQLEELTVWIQELASDRFLGRGPSSPGEEVTVNYLREEFQKLGLRPGNGDSYFQPVPLVDITVQGSPSLSVQSGGKREEAAWATEAVLWSKRVVEEIELKDSEMVFVGYGTVAPEYQWNDYEGLDVAGKTVVMMVNDPGYATEDQALFNGRTMTYYGRWTYKFEEAARQGAEAALIIHDTGPAGYGWDTVANSWTGPQFDLVRDDENLSRVAVEGWISSETANRLFAAAGRNLEELKAQAGSPGFRAVPLGLKSSVSFRNSIRRSESRNVLATLPGGDRSDEYVVYMAHWDHFGQDPHLAGDQIYNGALDNATGTAGLLALAKAFAGLPQPPSRSVLFLAVTAEEQGLLGSAYYASHPVIPRTKTVAAINMDGLNTLGPMKDITVVGYGNSELDDWVDQAAARSGRTVRSDPEPEKGYYYRSDHFSFAKVGIPALYTDAGIEHLEKGEAWTLAQRQDYLDNRYHQPSDEYDPNWDLRGAVDDLRLLFGIGYGLAHSNHFPNWRQGTEFRALRDQDMK